MSKQPHMLTELPNLNFSALHLYDGGVADQQEPQQDWAPVADARNTAVLRERGVTRLPSRLAPVPEQPQERKRQPEALAYMPMSPQTISSYDPCTTVASMMSPPASRDDGLLC
jgi:hypothetical protein